MLHRITIFNRLASPILSKTLTKANTSPMNCSCQPRKVSDLLGCQAKREFLFPKKYICSKLTSPLLVRLPETITSLSRATAKGPLLYLIEKSNKSPQRLILSVHKGPNWELLLLTQTNIRFMKKETASMQSVKKNFCFKCLRLTIRKVLIGSCNTLKKATWKQELFPFLKNETALRNDLN